MSRARAAAVACLALLSPVQPAIAESWMTTIWFIESSKTIRGSGTVVVTTVDEVERSDLSLLMYHDDLFDTELDYDEASCLYVSPATTCVTQTQHTPYEVGCKYCSDFYFDLLRNNGTWQVVWSNGGDVCVYPPNPNAPGSEP